jgi:hypothetical protein
MARSAQGRDDVVKARRIKPKKVQWLWRDRIPKGMICVVMGKPDQGKGLFAAHLTAHVTKRLKRNVLYSAAEDAADMMTRPRLEAAGADLNKCLVYMTGFQLPMQMEELRRHVIDNEIALLVIDPFTAHLRGVNRASDDIRQVLNPLGQLCGDTGMTCLIVEHALKRISPNSHPLTAMAGSGSGLPAATRAAYVFGVDPQDSDRRLLACVKMNIAPKPKAFAFETDVDEFPLVGDVPSLMPQGECEFDPIRLLQTKGGDVKRGPKPDKRAAAAQWLTEFLAAAKGPVPAGDVFEDAKQYGLSSMTIRRAAEDMDVVKKPPGGGRNCTWDLNNELKTQLGIELAQDEEDAKEAKKAKKGAKK